MENPLRLPPGATEQDLRTAIVHAGRIAYDRGLITADDGNLSARLDRERILLTPSGGCKGRLAPDGLLVLDLSGQVLSPGGGNARPSSETPMHLAAYRERPDVGAVIHAHPPYCIALTVAGIPLRADVLPEVLATLGAVPTSDFAMPASDENADAIRELIQEHDAILLRQHGALAVGADLEQALMRMERVEHAAMVIALATLLGKVDVVPPEARDRLLAMYAASRARPG